jgi:hypothetical protein
VAGMAGHARARQLHPFPRRALSLRSMLRTCRTAARVVHPGRHEASQAPVAQRIERSPPEREVVGSTPTGRASANVFGGAGQNAGSIALSAKSSSTIGATTARVMPTVIDESLPSLHTERDAIETKTTDEPTTITLSEATTADLKLRSY